jgi:hypothetical protein
MLELTDGSQVFQAPRGGCVVALEPVSLSIPRGTTSGCVRANVIDAFSQTFKISIVEECTFDRFESSHAINLFDMQAKYCGVAGVDEAATYLAGIGPGLYDERIAFPAVREAVLA